MTHEIRKSTPTQFLRDIPRPKIMVPALRQRERADIERRPNLFVHFVWDKSFSFEKNDAAIAAFCVDLVKRAKEVGLDDGLQIAITEMSGIAVTAPYRPVEQFRPVNLRSGGDSPHAAMLAEARKTDAPLICAPKTAILRFTLCDGRSTDRMADLERELAWLQNAQREDRTFHNFVLQMGRCNLNVLSAMSPMRPVVDVYDGDFSRFLNSVFDLINATIEDPSVPARTMSLRDIPKPGGAK